jgi:hypothetical protein
VTTPLPVRTRLLLWEYPRGSAAYGVVCLLLVLILLLVPASFWGDPMISLP